MWMEGKTNAETGKRENVIPTRCASEREQFRRK